LTVSQNIKIILVNVIVDKMTVVTMCVCLRNYQNDLIKLLQTTRRNDLELNNSKENVYCQNDYTKQHFLIEFIKLIFIYKVHNTKLHSDARYR